MWSMNNRRSGAFRLLRVMMVAAVAHIAPVAAQDVGEAGEKDFADLKNNSARLSAETIWAETPRGEVSAEILYLAHCSRCHRPDGRGSRFLFPPLAKSDFITANPKVMIPIVLYGMEGDITVNGLSYKDQAMPEMDYLTDQELASILTYVLNSWGNPGGEITAEEVAAFRNPADAEPKPVQGESR